MVNAEIRGQRVLRMCQAEGVALSVIRWHDFRHRDEPVTGDCGVTNAGDRGEHRVHVLGQAIAVNDRQTAAIRAAHDERNHDVAHRMLAEPAVGILVPEGVEVNVKVEQGLVAIRADLFDAVVRVVRSRAVRGIAGHMADPRDIRAAAHIGLHVGGSGERAERVHSRFVRLRGLGLGAFQRGVFEAAKNISHRFVDGRNAGNRNRAGNDAHGVRTVARILGLPQLVASPPTQQVVVDHRDERHWLGVFVDQGDEPCGVGRLDLKRVDLRVVLPQPVQRLPRVGFHVGAHREQRREFTGFLVAHAGLDALQQVQVAVRIGRVGPWEGQVDETLSPLAVGHRGNITEIRFRGLVERVDDFGAARLNLLGVLHHLDQQTAAARGRILHFVDIGVQMAQAGAHPADHLAGRHPAFAARGERVVTTLFERDAGGFDQHTLDLRAGMRLLGGHDGGADKHAVHRHIGLPVSAGPLARDVVRGALRRANAAAGDQHEVLASTHVGIGVEQQVVQRFPRMVAAGGTAFDLGDDGDRSDRLGDTHHLADLVDRARLERHIRQTVGTQGGNELLGFVELRDAGGDDDAVDRGAGRAFLRHQTLRAELEVPQVAVHEHRIEFDRAAFFEFVLELGQMPVKHFGGHLAAAGEFGPVSGVRRGRDNLRVHGGRGHAGQQDRRFAGQFAEFRGNPVTGGRVDDARTVHLPILQAFGVARQRGQRGAVGGACRLDHTGAAALGECGDQLASRGARAHIDNPQCGRIRGLKQLVHAACPIHMVDKHFLGEFASAQPIETARLRPDDRLIDGIGHQRRMERQRHVKVFERRVEHRAAAHLLLAQTRLLAVFLARGEREERQILRIARQNLMVGGVFDGDGDRSTGGGDARNQGFGLLAVGALD